jgi:hypothetical protein
MTAIGQSLHPENLYSGWTMTIKQEINRKVNPEKK